MAFLCPVRIKSRSKKKKGKIRVFNSKSTKFQSPPPPRILSGVGGPNDLLEKDLNSSGLGLNHGIGRITGSASIETLVRVGIEKEHGLSPNSKMVVLYDFTPCVDDELEVKRGQLVNILYRENDWVYVIGQDSRQEGFIPFSYCAPFTQDGEMAAAVKKKLPRDQQLDTVEINSSSIQDQPPVHLPEMLQTPNLAPDHLSMLGLQASHSQASLSCDPDFLPFAKDPSGRYIVLYTFIARDENDVSVERGEFVTVLNREDPDWFWIVRSDGQEGFIPSGFVYPADNVLHKGHLAMTTLTTAAAAATVNSNNAGGGGSGGNLTSGSGNILQQMETVEDLRYHGTELVMLYEYKAQAPDDLSVRRGDWIYADLNNQTVDGWLWAYAPKTRKYGFIPKAYARPPAMTSL